MATIRTAANIKHDETLGDPMQPASGTLVLNTSRIRDFVTCPRQYFLTHVLRLPRVESDVSGAGALGSAVHAELHARHDQSTNHARHDDESPVDESLGLEASAIALVRAHSKLCPKDSATYVDGELDLWWFIPRKSLLLTGRIDALWEFPDGTIEVRDYKTGAAPSSLHNDIGAAIYLLLAVNLPQKPARVRIVYEALRGEEPNTVTLHANRTDLRAAYDNVIGMADHIRKERTFPATPSPVTCRSCGHRALCPASAQRGED